MSKGVEITKEVQFDAGHRVPNHQGACRSPHGHRYRVVLHCVGDIIEDPTDPEYGMLVDFGRLKQFLQEIHEWLDHGFIVHYDDPLRTILQSPPGGETYKVIKLASPPTAENLARVIYAKAEAWIGMEFAGRPLRAKCVDVWETPTSMARYPGSL